MISWIVASHDLDTLNSNLLPSLSGAEDAGDDIEVMWQASSIAQAYNDGQKQARQPIRCYLHHDVRILDLPRLRDLLIEHCTPAVGLVGVIGSMNPVLPWWEGVTIGSVVDARMGLLNFSPGGTACSFLDGLLLATAQDVDWDTRYPGWHLYDHDMCRQMLDRSLPNYCLPGGAQLVEHNTTGSTSTDKLPGWAEGVTAFHRKWRTNG